LAKTKATLALDAAVAVVESHAEKMAEDAIAVVVDAPDRNAVTVAIIQRAVAHQDLRSFCTSVYGYVQDGWDPEKVRQLAKKIMGPIAQAVRVHLKTKVGPDGFADLTGGQLRSVLGGTYFDNLRRKVAKVVQEVMQASPG